MISYFNHIIFDARVYFYDIAHEEYYVKIFHHQIPMTELFGKKMVH